MFHTFPSNMIKGKITNGQFNSSRMDDIELFTGDKTHNLKSESDTKYLYMSGCCRLAQS